LLACVDAGLGNERFNNEFCNLIRLKYPNTVKFLDYCYDTSIESVEFHGRKLLPQKGYIDLMMRMI
jgi:hypothetical protein